MLRADAGNPGFERGEVIGRYPGIGRQVGVGKDCDVRNGVGVRGNEGPRFEFAIQDAQRAIGRGAFFVDQIFRSGAEIAREGPKMQAADSGLNVVHFE